MTAQTAGPLTPIIERAAAVIVEAQRQPHSAPAHWAGALLEAGLLRVPIDPSGRPSDLEMGEALVASLDVALELIDQRPAMSAGEQLAALAVAGVRGLLPMLRADLAAQVAGGKA